MESNFIYASELRELVVVPETAKLLSPDGYFFQPMLDYRGEQVVFWGRQLGENGFNIWRYDFHANSLRKLTADRAVSGHPFWSNDGRQIVYFSTVGVSNATEWFRHDQFQPHHAARNIWLMNSDGSQRTQLTHGTHLDEHPCFSPDGKFVVFVSDRSGSMNLWRIAISTGELDQLTTHASLDYRPIFSPTGDRLAFFSTNNPAHSHALCVMNWKTGSITFPIPDDVFAWVHGPYWLPDGKTLLLHGALAGQSVCNLWFFHLPSRQLERLTIPEFSSTAHGSLSIPNHRLVYDSSEKLNNL
ncbi:MAG: Protein TolB [Verrucomicrobiae bacterium]|nr:Protein TolB [Verrucomicrobiae bacterium]